MCRKMYSSKIQNSVFLNKLYFRFRHFSKYILIIAAFLYVFKLLCKNSHYTVKIQSPSEIRSNDSSVFIDDDKLSSKASIIYILHYVLPQAERYINIPQKQSAFKVRCCKHCQCYITREEEFFEDITKFDVIAFFEHGFELSSIDEFRNEFNFSIMPENRSTDQIYLFLSMEPAVTYPLCDEIYDDFFNLTCTYKLDSDIKCNYFEVLNEEGEVIGPNKDMNWIKTEDMRPVPDDLLEILQGKTKLVAWFVSNCVTDSKREEFVRKLELELDKYALEIDIYGDCGKFKCKFRCDKMLEKRFMFYLAFENAFDEDYVTEKVLHALDNSVVPVVYGGANYTRFMPDGSYLNARELGVERLAATLNRLMHNKDEYYKFFKWRNHYSYIRKPLYDVCEMCRITNEMKFRKEKKVSRNFREWWHPGRCKNYTKKY